MTDKEQGQEPKEDPRKVPLAQRHKIISDITQQLKGIELGESIEIGGHEYYLTTISSDEKGWTDQFISTASDVAFISSQRSPKLAASIKRIDGIHVDDLFKFPDDMNKEARTYHSDTSYRKRYWVMAQVLLWLGEMPEELLSDLWNVYVSLSKKQSTAWADLKKSSARIPGGESKVMSSPEKVSSQVAQM